MKNMNFISILLVFIYTAAPVQGSIFPSESKGCCCSSMADQNSCSCHDCEICCNKDISADSKQPLNTVISTSFKHTVRVENLPAKLSLVPTISELIQIKKPGIFAGQNNFDMSMTVTRLLDPLRI
jgi:hypothetical protein